MVSKPTGRKRGRPKKMAVAPSPKLDPWRPKVPLAKDPYRWELALIERDVLALMANGHSELEAHEMLATWRHGQIVRTPENLARFETAQQPYLVWMPPHKKFKIASSDTFTERLRDGWQWPNKNPFRPIGESCRKKIGRFRKQDGARLKIMVAIWNLCLFGEPNTVDEARRLAASIGESEHFENEMRPRCF